jgi:uncharacterized protein YciI
MSYYAVFLPMLDQEKSQKYREEHLAYLDKMRKKGNIFANGRFSDGAGGLVIYMASSFDEVKSFVENDPYVVEEARGYEIHPWEMVTDAVISE